MADESEPPDITCGKSYKCHLRSKANFIVCINCEEIYHLSDFNRLQEVKFLSDIFGICNIHKILTSSQSESSLSEDARLIIAEIKLNEIKRAQEKLQQDVNLTLSITKNSLHDQTILEDDDADMRATITENILLKQLNEELKQRNDLLLNMLEFRKNNKPTFSEITKTKTNKIEKIPEIKVISKSESVNNERAYNNVNKILQKDLPINRVKNKKNGIIIKCLNSYDVPRTSQLLKEKLGENFEVTMLQLNKPRLKILGISNDIDVEEIESDINDRNFYQFTNKCKVLHTFKCKNMTQGAIFEVTADLYEHINNNHHKVYTGHQCCKAYDDINVSLCFKCARHNHNGNKCNNEPKCIYCAGEHLSIDCKNRDKKQCPNCVYANEKYGENYKTDHIASDTQNCSLLKKN